MKNVRLWGLTFLLSFAMSIDLFAADKKTDNSLAWDQVILNHLENRSVVNELRYALSWCARRPYVAYSVWKQDPSELSEQYIGGHSLYVIEEAYSSESIDFALYFERINEFATLTDDDQKRALEQLTEIAALVVMCMVKHRVVSIQKITIEVLLVLGVPAVSLLSAYAIFSYGKMLATVPPTLGWPSIVG